ncbi:MAG TPA: complex I subunit 1 family protein [Gemmatimonadales bacterium]|nr:complex I subunit 1 family protein [Gemmatimonadales bacterium]
MTPELKGFLLISVAKLLLVFSVVMIGVAYETLLERWVCAWMQDRLGPNRAGPRGILQPIADGIKNIVKEEHIPATDTRTLYLLAPALALIPATMLAAVIPWGAPLQLHFDFTLGALGRFTYDGLTSTAVADLPIGFLYVLAFSSVGVYGIALAGWASNNKYSLLGGLRATAQMISYEVAMGLSLVPVLLLTGNVSFSQIIGAQQQGLWFFLPLLLSAFFFLTAGFAETNRVPFDLPESESELVAGYHTEYSAMKFSAFFIAEYSNMTTVSMMFTSLFLGGWDIPFTHWDETPGVAQTVATGLVFGLKVAALLFLFIWVRWTSPRFRYDQLMALGWKILTPLALGYVMVIATGLWAIDQGLGITSPLLRDAALFALNVPAALLLFRVLDRGTIIVGASRRTPSTASLGRAA